MTKRVLILLFTCACFTLQAQVNSIITICGNNSIGFKGDGNLATSAELCSPESLCLDVFNNIHIADAGNNCIRKINLFSGIINTAAGIGSEGVSSYYGDGVPATTAKLWIPQAVTTDSAGNVYIGDAANYRIRKITISTGIITTIAGKGTSGNSGDNDLAINAEFAGITGLYINKHGDLYIADQNNNNVRRIDGISKIITTVAGTGVAGYSGDRGLAISAQLRGPGQPCMDSLGNLYFSEIDNNVIRKVDVHTGIITTIAGTGSAGYSGDGGPATAAKMNQPYGLDMDKEQNLYVAEYGSGTIRRIDAITDIITTIAGTGTPGFSGDGGPATAAQLKPDGVVVDKQGIIYVADYGNNRIRKIYDPTKDYYSAVQTVHENTIKIYPNPAGNELIVTSPDLSEGEEVLIYNLWGQPFDKLRMTVHGTTAKIDVSGLPSGMYVIQIVDPSSGLRMTRRFVKE